MKRTTDVLPGGGPEIAPSATTCKAGAKMPLSSTAQAGSATPRVLPWGCPKLGLWTGNDGAQLLFHDHGDFLPIRCHRNCRQP
jgi:hypothetical protein